MIKKSLLFALILFISYTLFVLFLAPKWWNASQHQWQDNLIKAQHYIYSDSDSITNVILGSSLSCRLITDSLPQTYNLSFSGQSIYDGLFIVTHKEELPKHVFIEMNVALRTGSDDFTSSLYTPVMSYLKRIFPSLRADQQPIGIIGRLTAYFYRTKIAKQYHDQSAQVKTTKVTDDLFNKMLKIQIKDYSVHPDSALMNSCFEKLKEYVSILEKKGVKIVFFEIPVNNELKELPKAVAIRERFYHDFPPTTYSYIKPPDTIFYKTTDGQHLSGSEALDYTLFFRNRISLLMQMGDMITSENFAFLF
jgi:hypothetical protein